MEVAVDRTIQQLEPTVVAQMSTNLRNRIAFEMFMVEILQSIAWALAVVSLAICLISIFSTVMLDTETRKKEVAIRKVNGALTKDIAKLFGRTYMLIVLSQIFDMVEINPVVPILMGVLVVAVFIVVIIAWQVHKTMKVDPSEILAKE